VLFLIYIYKAKSVGTQNKKKKEKRGVYAAPSFSALQYAKKKKWGPQRKREESKEREENAAPPSP
jgi:predicted RNA-binding protein YlxR (DUF448 family)